MHSDKRIKTEIAATQMVAAIMRWNNSEKIRLFYEIQEFVAGPRVLEEHAGERTGGREGV